MPLLFFQRKAPGLVLPEYRSLQYGQWCRAHPPASQSGYDAIPLVVRALRMFALGVAGCNSAPAPPASGRDRVL